jgi:hypothetical protein
VYLEDIILENMLFKNIAAILSEYINLRTKVKDLSERELRNAYAFLIQ